MSVKKIIQYNYIKSQIAVQSLDRSMLAITKKSRRGYEWIKEKTEITNVVHKI